MKVVQVLSAAGAAYGGAVTTSLSIHSALLQIDPDMMLVSTTYAGNAGGRICRAERNAVEGHGNVELFEPCRPHSWQFSLDLMKALPAIIRSSDIVHIHGLHMFASVYAYLVCRVLGKPYGIQPHGVLEPYDRAKSAVKKRLFMHLVGLSMFKNATYVTFASESEAANAADIVPSGTEIVAPLGVSLSPELRPQNEELASFLEHAGRSKSFLYLGRYTTKKQPKLALEAWAKGHPPGCYLILAGPDGSVTAGDLRRYAATLGISSSVVVSGVLSAAECVWVFARCSYFILPSLNENFGLTAVEAMAAGCYVITTSDVAASAHVVHAGGGDVLDSPSAQELSEAYLRAPSRLNLAEANAAYVASEASWSRTAQIIYDRIQSSLP